MERRENSPAAGAPGPPTVATLTIGIEVWKLHLWMNEDAQGFGLSIPANREMYVGRDPDPDTFTSMILEAIAISTKDENLLKYARSF